MLVGQINRGTGEEIPIVSTALIAVDCSASISDQLAQYLNISTIDVEIRHFPDGESYVRLAEEVNGRDIVLLFGLHRPDNKLASLLFLVDVLRDYGSQKIGLVAPYLPYMRQDKRFRSGEAVTSVTFAKLISATVDWLITVDPHLHRYPNLGSIYTIPTHVVAAAASLAKWLQTLDKPVVLVGPDRESGQWVAEVAARSSMPYVVAEKRRHGDRQVDIDLPALTDYLDRTPVIIDDIVSSGTTVLEAAQHIRQFKQFADGPLWVAAIHGVFDQATYQRLKDNNINIATSNTIVHESNRFNVDQLLSEACASFVR